MHRVQIGECYLISTIMNNLKTKTTIGEEVSIIVSDTVLIEKSKSEIGEDFKQTVVTQDFPTDFLAINTSRKKHSYDGEEMKDDEQDSEEGSEEEDADESFDSGDAEIRDEKMLEGDELPPGYGGMNLRKRLRNKDDNMNKARTRDSDQLALR